MKIIISESQLEKIVKHKLQEEKVNEAGMLTEGWLGKIAGTLGITLATLGAAMGQSAPDMERFDKAMGHKNAEKVVAALQNPKVQETLKKYGVEDNAVGAAIKYLDGRAAAGINKFDKVEQITTKDEQRLMVLLTKGGWHLTNVEVNYTIEQVKKINTDTVVNKFTQKFDNVFESGRYKIIDNALQGKLQQILQGIKDKKNVLLHVVIESSTDKQGLSTNLAQELQAAGFSGDNQGLSEARNSAVGSLLAEMGVDVQIIQKTVLTEKGEGEIDQSARYVNVSFEVMETSTIVTDEMISQQKENRTYQLIRGQFTPKGKDKFGQQNGGGNGGCNFKLGSYKAGTGCPHNVFESVATGKKKIIITEAQLKRLENLDLK